MLQMQEIQFDISSTCVGVSWPKCSGVGIIVRFKQKSYLHPLLLSVLLSLAHHLQQVLHIGLIRRQLNNCGILPPFCISSTGFSAS